MKKVINGSLYDTETAHLIGGRSHGDSRSDFNFYEEEMYRTKSGKYFLFGSGGANSRYGVWNGNTGKWGNAIRAYSLDEAMAWVADNLDGDAYIAEFGEPEEDGEKVKLTVYVSGTTREVLDRIKRDTGKLISRLVEDAFSGDR